MGRFACILSFFIATLVLASSCNDDDSTPVGAAASLVYNEDADLWTNMATLTLRAGNKTTNVSVEYRKEGSETWKQALVTLCPDGSYKAVIRPEWIDAGQHPSGAALYTLDNTTGVFAGNTYQYRALSGEVVLPGSEGSFTTAAGQTIPGGNMNTWSKYIGFNPEWVDKPTYDDYKADYPNPGIEQAFWSNGNNAFALTLCTPGVHDEAAPEERYAALQGNAAFGTIFAAGNLFSGVFELPGMAGYARFGQKYAFTARPSGIKVRLRANVNTITMLHPDETFPLPEGAKIGKVDPARVFVCITDWKDRHSVYSGLGVKPSELNAFDPVADTADPVEGPIIAYAARTITESVAQWQEVVIPLVYKSKTARPSADTYSLVISSASNAYGDYLCGCPDNTLDLDDFEWVY